MKILFMRKVNNGRIKADFSVEWEDRLIIHHCVLMENHQGKLFIKFPWRVYTARGQKIHETIVEVKQELLMKISELALHEYEQTK